MVFCGLVIALPLASGVYLCWVLCCLPFASCLAVDFLVVWRVWFDWCLITIGLLCVLACVV